jgi:hypothetical protein
MVSLVAIVSLRVTAQRYDVVHQNVPHAWEADGDRPDTVITWNVHAEQTLNQAAQERGQPNRARLEMAMVQGAVYDAVNAIARTHESYLSAPPAFWWYSKDAAAATAAYRTLIALLPDRESALAPLYEQSLAEIPDGAAKAGGIRVGVQSAEMMMAAREDDGRDGPRQPVIGTLPGEWRPTPPSFAIDATAWTGDVKPFLIPSSDWLRTQGPNRLTSRAYAQELQEVMDWGSRTSRLRTQEQTDIALYWNLAPWGDIIRSLIRDQHLNTADAARLLGMLHLAAADAQIACVNDKNYWSWWRPITAIREADTDGNPGTTKDKDWWPLIETPGFPEHPAGHTAGSGAIVGMLQNFFRADRIRFSAWSPGSRTTRTFDSFSQALEEVINSRVWGGIHFRTGDIQGARLGMEVARWARTHYFKPVKRPS